MPCAPIVKSGSNQFVIGRQIDHRPRLDLVGALQVFSGVKAILEQLIFLGLCLTAGQGFTQGTDFRGYSLNRDDECLVADFRHGMFL